MQIDDIARKNELVDQLHGLKNSEAARIIDKLVEMEIEEIRVQNDTDTTIGVKRNQGKIMALKKVSSWIRVGVMGIPREP
jgi:hypothetical protein